MTPQRTPLDNALPRVAVLLATFNGAGYIAEQVASLLQQESCIVDIWISDDQSTDGTWEWLNKQSLHDPRIRLLPRIHRLGNAARNFYRLLRDVDAAAYHYVALSDQDDIWFTHKLASSIEQLRERNVAAISSNVIAVWPNGKRRLIRKSQRQQRLDFLFESAGQGCTYVVTAECAAKFKMFLISNGKEVESVQFHDWLLYAWARSHAMNWHIDSRATVLYRQHGANVQGVNSGWTAFRRRAAQVRSGWYRNEILKIAELVRHGPTFTVECAAIIGLVGRSTVLSRIALAASVCLLRRRMKDRAAFALACVLGWF